MEKIGDTGFEVLRDGPESFLIRGEVAMRYLMLPIEDKAEAVKITLVVENRRCMEIDVRLARHRVDYRMPLDLSAYNGRTIALIVEATEAACFAWNEIRTVDKPDVSVAANRFRPVYHFSPRRGWMNDPNGMFFLDGVYHFCYQYNPYGATWGNMSWGHATSRDLVTWTEHPVALERDGFGAIFSGCAVVDHSNDAGFGQDAVIAFYTNAGAGQMQCIAVSTDRGETFTKYAGDPVLTSEEADFRDPKVFWHRPTARWIMLLAVGQHMEIYSSANLLDWRLESAFGATEGAHGGVWECPDLFELPVEGEAQTRWVLLCSINPGGPYGSSATQYFVGSFDGKTFVNESPGRTQWMDFGKDYYAAVTWANLPDGRIVAMGWMNSWIYANEVPTAGFRGADATARELSLFRWHGALLLRSTPAESLRSFERQEREVRAADVDRKFEIDPLFAVPTSAYAVEVQISAFDADAAGIVLSNRFGEEVLLECDFRSHTLRMNRDRSGSTDFALSDSFCGETTAPLLEEDSVANLRILVDACSIEVFIDDGRAVMTNLVFPQEPYNRLRIFAHAGDCRIDKLTLLRIDTAKSEE